MGPYGLTGQPKRPTCVHTKDSSNIRNNSQSNMDLYNFGYLTWSRHSNRTRPVVVQMSHLIGQSKHTSYTLHTVFLQENAMALKGFMLTLAWHSIFQRLCDSSNIHSAVWCNIGSSFACSWHAVFFKDALACTDTWRSIQAWEFYFPKMP